jgi:hypothetical protein
MEHSLFVFVHFQKKLKGTLGHFIVLQKSENNPQNQAGKIDLNLIL